jgi:chromosomal replication initiator protein
LGFEVASIFARSDGTDMLDCVTEIPLPGRVLVPSKVPPRNGAARNPLPSFVAGPENHLVAGAFTQLLQTSTATADAAKPFTPALLVLFGPSGTGKSHLATGLVRHWQAQFGEASATYTTAADFRHRLNDAIKRQAELAFRNEFRGSDLLVIDDLQHLPADDYAFQELRYTLDDYEDRGATVIITSSEAVNSLPNLPADLRSRLSAGLALQLAPPGVAARVRIINHAATAIDCPISSDTAERLAKGVEGNANNLFRALFELSSTSGSTISTQAADELLAAHSARRPTIREITAVVARNQNVPQSQLKSSSRKQSIVFARGLIVYLARELADLSYEEIGRALGGRDHTTIIHNYRKIAHECETNPQTAQSLETLRCTLLNR